MRCTSSKASYRSRSHPGGRPRQKVRVWSVWYPARLTPKSTTTGSPGSIARSPAPTGNAADRPTPGMGVSTAPAARVLGPDTTCQGYASNGPRDQSRPSWPQAMARARSSPAHSASVTPGRSVAAACSYTRATSRPASRIRSTSQADLRRRSPARSGPTSAHRSVPIRASQPAGNTSATIPTGPSPAARRARSQSSRPEATGSTGTGDSVRARPGSRRIQRAGSPAAGTQRNPSWVVPAR